MKKVIALKVNPDKNSEFVIHPVRAENIGLSGKKIACLCFGSRKQYVDIKMDESIPEDNILLSQKLMNELHIPDYSEYEVRVNKNEIIIGPYIGLLVSEKDENLTESRLKRLLIYVSRYQELNGAIVVFALDKVDQSEHLIEGFCYNPSRACWQKGIFPYPASVFRSIGLSRKWKNHFLSVIGDRIFNSLYFSKWRMYQWFSEDEEISRHIPFTTLYRSPEEALELLKKYGKIYIKPAYGLQGRGIVQLSKEEGIYAFRYRENGVNCHIMLDSEREAVEYIRKHFSSSRYIVQQAIDLIDYKGGIIDFRCIMQKNKSDLWECKAIIGRRGEKGSVVSNISNGGGAFTIDGLVKRGIKIFKDDPEDLKKRIKEFTLNICNALDRFGANCGTLGLDIGVDTSGYLWLIEINNRDPDLTIALNVNDLRLYYDLKTAQLHYAKSLAGFTEPPSSPVGSTELSSSP